MAGTPESDFKRFHNAFKDDLTFIDRSGFFELIPKGFSKATGMKFLENYFKIPHKDTIAFGDSSNDIPMFEYAETAILMGGAKPELQKYATFVTTKITEDGIYNACKKTWTYIRVFSNDKVCFLK
ncbi:MAG: HAD-IIB family hydrolase [Treponema sp.]|nr:HAD-IIB family hydrolase [Treponema sp.]